jgi:IclR family pca regulon transcriptional regulator
MILSALSERQPVLGIADIARAVNLSKSTTYRYVSTLTQLDYLNQDPDTKKYSLGSRAVDLGFAAINSMELTRIAARPLQALADDTGYTVSMVVLDGGDIVYVDRRRSGRASEFGMELNLHIGSRLPAYCTAMGKVLLAYRDQAALRAILDRTDLARRGPKTITAREQLMSALTRVRHTGLAVNDEELTPGLRALAAPVRDRSGTVIASVGIVVNLATWNASIEAIVARLEAPLRAATADISSHLGFRAGEESPRTTDS